MTVLVVGASGATGRLLVEQLLNSGLKVRVVVRTPDALPLAMRQHDSLSLVHANLLDLGDRELQRQVKGCTAVVSCLGHTLSFAGIYGQPRMLVTNATRRLCAAIVASKPASTVKFILMNTTGNSNRDIPETNTFAHNAVITLLRMFLPPHVDNEKAADFLRTRVTKRTNKIEWVTVRPDSLVDECEVSEYDLHPSPTRDALFDAGVTSRINVAHFMAELITDDELWQQWRGKMPVIYDQIEP